MGDGAIDYSGRVHFPGLVTLQLHGADHDVGREVVVELKLGPTAFEQMVPLGPTEAVRLAVALLTEALPTLEADGTDLSVLTTLTAITDQAKACADRL